MKRSLPGLLALALWPQVLPALDLTPVHGFRDLEGVSIPVVFFTDGARTVTYQPPTDWRISGGGKSIQLYPPGRDGAVVQFRQELRATSDAGGDPESFARWARGHLPPHANSVERTGECSGQFTLGASASRALNFTYTLSGHRYLASVAAVALDEKERLAVVVTARQRDFGAVHEEAIASLFRWQWDE